MNWSIPTLASSSKGDTAIGQMLLTKADWITSSTFTLET